MKHFFRKACAAAAAFALSCTAMTAMPSAVPASAANTYWKFDFGGGGTASGYTGVSASTGYNASAGYGFSSGTAVTNVAAAGSGALSDAVQFTNATKDGNYTFCADVPNGLYQVSVWLGNTNRTSVGIERMYQIMNMTGNNAYHTLQVPVTDGQLNICACEGKAGYAFTMSALEIKQISTQTHTNPTIWVCGDSTVCNYYPLDSSAQAGWAHMLPQFIDGTKWQVMNMATSGQFAKGFVDAGQFEVIKKNAQPDDIYVISIGINDGNYSNRDEYYATVKSMAQTCIDKGMRVILVKQQGRNGDCQRSPLLEGRWFGAQLDQIGSELNIEVVDLFNLWQDYCLTKSVDEVSAMYLDDGLHPNRAGATVLAQFMAAAINEGGGGTVIPGAEFEEGTAVMFRNAESGLYLSVEGGAAAAGTNVSQTADNSVTAKNVWKLVSAGEDGAYYIYSMLDGGGKYLLDIADGKTDNGTNVGIWTDTASNAQVFKLLKDGDYYHIATAVSDYKSYVGITGGSHDEGANAIEWSNDGTANQKWIMQLAQYSAADPLLQGDLDGDRVITAKDLTLLKRVALGLDQNTDRKIAGDLDGNVKVTAEDVRMMQQYLLGEIAEFGNPTYPASEQNFISGVHESTNAGYRYDDYLNLENSVMSAVTFRVNVPAAGNYACIFNIANGSANARKMIYAVSGQEDVWQESFLSTGNWTTWAEYTVVLPFAAGVNYLTLRSTMAEGAPNIDFMKMIPTDEPVSQTVDPEQVVTTKPVVYIASDSVAQTYNASYAPQQGWGKYLGDCFTDDVTVANHAIAGRSSKKFIAEGRLQTILDNIKEGDYLLVCFSINDADYTKEDRYAPVCGNVDNPEVDSYEYCITQFINGAKAKGATPILMSTTLSIKRQTQPFKPGYTNYAEALVKLAAKYNVPYFDFTTAMANQFNSVPFTTAYNYYLGSAGGDGTTNDGDFTHLNETGAPVVAKIAADGIKGLNIGLSKYVK